MSKYDELKSYLPDVFTSVLDVDTFLYIIGMQMDDIDKETSLMRDNNFIFLSDEKSIMRWEKFMDIPYNQQRTLDDRKKLIVSFFIGNGRIGANEIKELIGIFTKSPVEVLFKDSTVIIKITKDVEEALILSDCFFILRKKIPAHLGIGITVISSFTLHTYIHARAKSYMQEIIDIPPFFDKENTVNSYIGTNISAYKTGIINVKALTNKSKSISSLGTNLSNYKKEVIN